MKILAKTKLLFEYGEPYVLAAYQINDTDGIIIGAVDGDITVLPFDMSNMKTSYQSAIDIIRRVSHAKTIEEVIPYAAE